MVNKLMNKLSDFYETEDGSKLQFTTDTQMSQFIFEAIKAFEFRFPDRKNAIHTYFSIWKQIFDKLDYNAIDRIPMNPFQWLMKCPFPSFNLYSVFSVDSIFKDSEFLRKSTLKEANLRILNPSPLSTAPLRPVDWNNPILICDALSESIIIDGNHRYQNAFVQKLDIPVLILSYKDLSKQHFINEFNFAVFICAEETKQFAVSFDDGAIMKSYLRIGNKFNL